MASTAFFSDNGNLMVPEKSHSTNGDYKPIAIGEPLCIEILNVQLGNVKDWWGNSEIMISTWAKTGGDSRPAPRVINAYRDNLKKFEQISDLGAEKFGHSLIYYSPAYSGETVRMTYEFLEIDTASEDIDKLAGAIGNNLANLPFFASQLPVLAALKMAPDIAKIGRKIYNMINRNDTILKGDLDLSFKAPNKKVLSEGRYVIVYGGHNTKLFTGKYKLNDSNQLVDLDDNPISVDKGLQEAYIVIQVTAEARDEYKTFEPMSQAQDIVGGYLRMLNEDTLLGEFASIANEIIPKAVKFTIVETIQKYKRSYDKAKPDQKEIWKKRIQGELQKLDDATLAEALTSALDLD